MEAQGFSIGSHDSGPEPLPAKHHEKLPYHPLPPRPPRPIPDEGYHPSPVVPSRRTFNEWGALTKIVFETQKKKPKSGPVDMVMYANLTLKEGDTLVYVDIPSAAEEQRKRTTCGGIVPASQHFWVHSENLFALTDSKFPQMLDNAIYQARVKRRRKPSEELLKGVKYFLDLTPPVEGDDLVFQISELSLTPGVIKWWTAHSLYNIDQDLVSGHDDICCCNSNVSLPKVPESQPSPTENFPQKAPDLDDGTAPVFFQNLTEKHIMPPRASDILALQNSGKDVLIEPPPHYRIPDYCVIRHCHSIIRLMLMIEGKSVNLDSAARVWSMVAVSKIFEAPSVIRDQVATWIMSNTTFIEALPEEALRIGYRLQLPDVTQSAFRILVNELALEEAADEPELRRPRRQVTVFGRRLGSPDDETDNVIQHAARAFIDRLGKQYDNLAASFLLDRLEIEEWSRMRELENILEQEDDGTFAPVLTKLRSLMSEIQTLVINNIKTAADRSIEDYDLFANLDNDRASYTDPKAFDLLRFILPRFNTTQILLCPFIYTSIGLDMMASMTEDTWYTEETQSLTWELQNKISRCQDRNDWSSRGVSYQIRDRKDWSAWGSFLQLMPEGGGANLYYQKLKEPLFSISKLRKEIEGRLQPFIQTWDRTAHGFQFALPITRHMLLTLTNNEMKYLPLWAGGNDDGTGGVFEEFLPPAEMGPNGPGPAYHTGQTIPSEASSVSGSLMEEIQAMKLAGSTAAGSSVARSMDAQDSISTVYRPDQVIALGSSIASESFEDDTSEFDRAVLAAPADHQDTNGLHDVAMLDDMDDDSMSDMTITSFDDDFAFEEVDM